ncbi:hypothetical protein [Streptomyces sp. NPDC006645]|uniref:hypothetical protein n=1 Tax=unclassified Streptomyces TaxID=2593676 RepID=UPI0033A43EB3
MSLDSPPPARWHTASATLGGASVKVRVVVRAVVTRSPVPPSAKASASTGPSTAGSGAPAPAGAAVSQNRVAPSAVAVHDVAGRPLDDTEREAAKRAALRAAYEVCGTRRVGGAQITVYARPGAC